MTASPSEVSVQAGIVDLSAAKFGLDGLGIPGEKILLKVLVASKDGGKKLTLFGSYTVGGRHAQISSQQVTELGTEIDVASIERYSLKNVVGDIQRALANNQIVGRPQVKWEKGKVWLDINGEVVPVVVKRVYVAAAKIWLSLECQGKHMRLALGDGVEMFDNSRRALAGMRMKGEKLILERTFQHLETQKT